MKSYILILLFFVNIIFSSIKNNSLEEIIQKSFQYPGTIESNSSFGINHNRYNFEIKNDPFINKNNPFFYNRNDLKSEKEIKDMQFNIQCIISSGFGLALYGIINKKYEERSSKARFNKLLIFNILNAKMAKSLSKLSKLFNLLKLIKK